MNRRIENAVRQAASERDLNFNAVIKLSDGVIVVDTRITRDPNRSRNGGEYSYWEKFWSHRAQVLAQTFCSCDFWQPEEEPEILGLNWDELVNLTQQYAREYDVPVES